LSWITVKRALLQRVAPLVSELTVRHWQEVEQPTSGGMGSWPLESVLDAVRPQLTSLTLVGGELPHTAVRMLARLPRLVSLECMSVTLGAEAFCSIAQLT
jgi:hypothetical protein